jgi:hypothetical protein
MPSSGLSFKSRRPAQRAGDRQRQREGDRDRDREREKGRRQREREEIKRQRNIGGGGVEIEGVERGGEMGREKGNRVRVREIKIYVERDM